MGGKERSTFLFTALLEAFGSFALMSHHFLCSLSFYPIFSVHMGVSYIFFILMIPTNNSCCMNRIADGTTPPKKTL